MFEEIANYVKKSGVAATVYLAASLTSTNAMAEKIDQRITIQGGSPAMDALERDISNGKLQREASGFYRALVIAFRSAIKKMPDGLLLARKEYDPADDKIEGRNPVSLMRATFDGFGESNYNVTRNGQTQGSIDDPLSCREPSAILVVDKDKHIVEIRPGYRKGHQIIPVAYPIDSIPLADAGDYFSQFNGEDLENKANGAGSSGLDRSPSQPRYVAPLQLPPFTGARAGDDHSFDLGNGDDDDDDSSGSQNYQETNQTLVNLIKEAKAFASHTRKKSKGKRWGRDIWHVTNGDSHRVLDNAADHLNRDNMGLYDGASGSISNAIATGNYQPLYDALNSICGNLTGIVYTDENKLEVVIDTLNSGRDVTRAVNEKDTNGREILDRHGKKIPVTVSVGESHQNWQDLVDWYINDAGRLINTPAEALKVAEFLEEVRREGNRSAGRDRLRSKGLGLLLKVGTGGTIGVLDAVMPAASGGNGGGIISGP